MTQKKPLSVSAILRFYLPLVLTSQMMTLSGPIINSGIGQSEDKTLNFAGFWLGFAVLLFLESPCLMVQGVSATLVTGYQSVRRLFLSALLMGATATVLILAAALTPFGDLLLGGLIPTTPRVAELARSVLLIFSAIPILISIRGVANGLAIREKRTVLVARATFVRLLVLSGIVAIAVRINTGSGALAGAAALVSGIAFETILIVSQTLPYVLRRRRDRMIDNPSLTYRTILKVATPLVAAAIVWTISRPIVNAVLGLLPDPELAQASFGVIMPIALVTCSPLWAIHNVSLVLPQTRADLRNLLRFTAVTSLLFSMLILLLAATPLRDFVLYRIFDLTPELGRLVAPAIFLVIAEPAILASRTFAQGLLMKAKRTEVMLIFAPAKIILIGAAGYIAVRLMPGLNGAILGAALFIAADLFDATVFGWKAHSLIRQGILFGSDREERKPEAALATAARQPGG